MSIAIDLEGGDGEFIHVTDESNKESQHLKLLKRVCSLPFVFVNVLYNLRMELLIVWAVYEIASETVVAGNTRSAEKRFSCVNENSVSADFQCADMETARLDFESYGLMCIFFIAGLFGVQWILFLNRIWLCPYGSVDYVIEYVLVWKSILYKFIMTFVSFVIMAMVIYGFLVAYTQGAPVSNVASPLLEGLYTCGIACYELFDFQPFTMRRSSENVGQVMLPFSSAMTDMGGIYLELERSLLAAKVNDDMRGLQEMGLTDVDIALLLNDGIIMEYDRRQKFWKNGKWCHAARLTK